MGGINYLQIVREVVRCLMGLILFVGVCVTWFGVVLVWAVCFRVFVLGWYCLSSGYLGFCVFSVY